MMLMQFDNEYTLVSPREAGIFNRGDFAAPLEDEYLPARLQIHTRLLDWARERTSSEDIMNAEGTEFGGIKIIAAAVARNDENAEEIRVPLTESQLRILLRLSEIAIEVQTEKITDIDALLDFVEQSDASDDQEFEETGLTAEELRAFNDDEKATAQEEIAILEDVVNTIKYRLRLL